MNKNEVVLYRISIDGKTESFQVDLQPHSHSTSDVHDAPQWIQLEEHQCVNCPLDSEEHPLCPLAQNLAPMVTQLGNFRSHSEVELEVTYGNRTIVQKSTLQQVLGSLMGLLTATSGCPHTEFLRPMARFHQPLSTPDETIYRASSMYMLAQFFRQKKGLEADQDLNGLVLRYRHLQIVNRGLADRIRSTCEDDGAVNAVVLLDGFAKMLPLASKDELSKLEPWFKAYLED